MSDLAAVMLTEYFPFYGEREQMSFRYNRIIANRFHEILDFINLHYCLTRRTDSDFWREVGKPARMTDRLRAKLAFWRIKPPSPADFEDQWFPGQPDTPLHSGGLAGEVAARLPAARRALLEREEDGDVAGRILALPGT